MQPLTNLLPSAYLKLAEEVNVALVYLVKTIELMEAGATIPFLARYRKEATGNLDEDRLRLLEQRLEYHRDLEDRRKTVLKTIEEQGKLTAELRAKIEATLDKNELEDLYLPYKPKKKTRASAARDKGLEPLADWLRAQRDDGRAPEQAAEAFLAPDKGVENVEQALAGARDILAEWISDDPELRRALRRMMWDQGLLLARKSDQADELLAQEKETKSKFEGYYDYREPVAKIPSHRLLAVRRGVNEGFLTAEISLEEAGPIDHLLSRLIRDRNSVFASQIEAAARDSYHRLINPSLQNDIRAELKERADAEAIRVFQENLQALLLAAPAGPIGVMGVDPGYKNGCKIAVVDQTGKFLESVTLYPHEPRNDADGARAGLKDLIARHNVRAVAIGNGAASRETDLFIRAMLRDEKIEGVFSIVVSEAGASVYSASRLAKDEFPDVDVTIRGAISIARRLQDPLSELVKIEPKAIGVGQYQHDVDQNRLGASLNATVESCVNRVGVDLNTASAPLLRYVAGINERVAKRIVEHRQTNGRFASRAQLRDVPGFGHRTFEQAAGFLRIRDGENLLDATAVHPESYPIVERMAASLGVPVADLVSRPELVEQLKLEEFQTENAGLLTLKDIQEELKQPGRDPRAAFAAPQYRDDVLLISDLKEGMTVEGVVSNVTNFGAFVDVGVHQDGLVHVSELSDKFVKDPREAVKVGDVVKVRVLSADPVAKRISLSMKPPPPPKVERPPRPVAAPPVVTPPPRAATPPANATPRGDAAPRGDAPPSRDRKGAVPKPKPMTLEEKLALLSNKFRTRV